MKSQSRWTNSAQMDINGCRTCGKWQKVVFGVDESNFKRRNSDRISEQ